jgi:hypothetical protein
MNVPYPIVYYQVMRGSHPHHSGVNHGLRQAMVSRRNQIETQMMETHFSSIKGLKKPFPLNRELHYSHLRLRI